MTLEPLLLAPLVIQLHVVTVVLAWLVGTYVMFFVKRGTSLHKTLVYVFMGLLTTTSFIALFIHHAAPILLGFSLVHLTIPWTLLLIFLAIQGARKKSLGQHRLAIIGLYVGSLTITGIVNLVTPTHLIHHVFFTK